MIYEYVNYDANIIFDKCMKCKSEFNVMSLANDKESNPFDYDKVKTSKEDVNV